MTDGHDTTVDHDARSVHDVRADPRAAYTRALAEEQAQLDRLRRWLRGVVWIRITTLIACVVLIAQACSHQGSSPGGAWTSAAIFLVLTVAIAWIERRIAGREARARYLEAGLARVQGHPASGAPDGKRFFDAGHPYAMDLDIVGPASLFSLLCAARTSNGQATLAHWLGHAASIDDIRKRQRAVGELRTRLSLRMELWLAGGLVSKHVREEALEAWLSAPATPVGLGWRVATGVFGLAGVGVLYAFWDPRFIAVAAAIVLVQRLFALKHRPLAQRVQSNAFERVYELRVLARLARMLEGQRFVDPHLAALVSGISQSGLPASRHIFRLVRLVDWLESRRNQLFGIIAWALLLPEQLSFAIEAWRARHGAAAVGWLAAIGEVEALTSLGTFSFEHPDYRFPDLLADSEHPRLQATALGHPLIPAATRVCNDIALGDDRSLLMVTGSNMSGKSTLLRTVGVNVVLALAGAPVCATVMRLTPLHIGASLRAQDSLDEGVSRFFAEIKRLHAILQMAEQSPPVLFLLDEILNGTNSIDRREGASAVVRRLRERGAVGLVTTHDLALADLADAPELRGANIHFQDSLDGDRLLFDYRIRTGVVTRRNALDLMRLVGIDVPTKSAPSGGSSG
jgi:hypothetical protein